MANIVVIDDSEVTLRTLTALLRSYGHQARRISDSMRAMDELAKDIPDLVILDVNMPNVDGIELLSQIGQHPGLRSTKVIMYSAQSDSAVVAESLRLGAVEYVQKGTPWEQLHETIMHHLRAVTVTSDVPEPAYWR